MNFTVLNEQKERRRTTLTYISIHKLKNVYPHFIMSKSIIPNEILCSNRAIPNSVTEQHRCPEILLPYGKKGPTQLLSPEQSLNISTCLIWTNSCRVSCLLIGLQCLGRSLLTSPGPRSGFFYSIRAFPTPCTDTNERSSAGSALGLCIRRIPPPVLRCNPHTTVLVKSDGDVTFPAKTVLSTEPDSQQASSLVADFFSAPSDPVPFTCRRNE